MVDQSVRKLVAGDTLGERYRIVALLGEGGMSRVYLAEDLKLVGKRWAVKQTVSPHLEMHDEARMLMAVKHPFLPNMVDYFPPDEHGVSYLIMDYVEGETLQERFLRQQMRCSCADIVRYARQLCEVLGYLHHAFPQPIIYRDLKPANIMIDQHNDIRLIDFGIARNYKQNRRADTVQIGTIGFAAPEQFSNQQTDHRTDLYTLGAVMYYLLSGGKLYFTERAPLVPHPQNCPAWLADIVHRLLAEDPDDRYQSAQEVLEQLQRFAALETDIQHQVKNHVNVVKRSAMTQPSRKMIAFASLYPCAGSTFLTFFLARCLQRWKVHHTVIEAPLGDPAFEPLLNLDLSQTSPVGGLDYETSEQAEPSPYVKFDDDVGRWVVLSPQSVSPYRWNSKLTLQLLHGIKSPLMIADLSHRWDTEIGQEFVRWSDELYMVIDPRPEKLFSVRARRSFERLMSLADSGKPVYLLANRIPKHFAQKKELKHLPLAPLCYFPYIPYENILASAWKGEAMIWREEVFSAWLGAAKPMLQRILGREFEKLEEQAVTKGWKRMLKKSL